MCKIVILCGRSTFLKILHYYYFKCESKVSLLYLLLLSIARKISHYSILGKNYIIPTLSLYSVHTTYHRSLFFLCQISLYGLLSKPPLIHLTTSYQFSTLHNHFYTIPIHHNIPAFPRLFLITFP